MISYARQDTHLLMLIFDKICSELKLFSIKNGFQENYHLDNVFEKSKGYCEKVFHINI